MNADTKDDSVALILWGVGVFWLSIALLTVCDVSRARRIPVNIGWVRLFPSRFLYLYSDYHPPSQWGFTFPLGVHAASTTALARQLDSGFFRVFGTVQSLCVVALWAFISVLTAWKAWEGTMFIGESFVRASIKIEADLG